MKLFNGIYIYLAVILTVICHVLKDDSFVDEFLSQAVVDAINPLTAKLFNWNFHPLEVVSR